MKREFPAWFVAGVVMNALIPSGSFGLEVPMPAETSPETGMMRSLSGPFRNSDLPKHVVAEFGKVTFFADHDHKVGEGIPLYLVNRGSEPVSWNSADGAPDIVLEQFDTESKTWRQAQLASSAVRDCGLGLGPKTLMPGQFFKTIGYRPAKGREGKVRFRLADGLVSNEGIGLWSDADVARTEIDRHAFLSQPFVRDLCSWSLQRDFPGQQSSSRVLAELELMQVLENGKVFRVFANAFRAELVRHSTEKGVSHEVDLKAVDALLAKRQTDAFDLERLFKRCIAVLRQPRGTRHGSPEMEQESAWIALDWLEGRPGFGQHERWKATFDLLQSRLPEAKEFELKSMAGFLSGNGMAYEYLPRDFFIESARTYPALAMACLERLAGCKDWDAMVSVAEGKDIDFRLLVLQYFCVDPTSITGLAAPRFADDERQKEFWAKCIRDSPWKSVQKMALALGQPDGYSIDLELWGMLMDEAKLFVEKAGKEPWPDEGGESARGLAHFGAILGRNPWSGSVQMLELLRGLGEIRPEGETGKQNERRKALAKEAQRLLRNGGWDGD